MSLLLFTEPDEVDDGDDGIVDEHEAKLAGKVQGAAKLVVVADLANLTAAALKLINIISGN